MAFRSKNPVVSYNFDDDPRRKIIQSAESITANIHVTKRRRSRHSLPPRVETHSSSFLDDTVADSTEEEDKESDDNPFEALLEKKQSPINAPAEENIVITKDSLSESDDVPESEENSLLAVHTSQDSTIVSNKNSKRPARWLRNTQKSVIRRRVRDNRRTSWPFTKSSALNCSALQLSTDRMQKDRSLLDVLNQATLLSQSRTLHDDIDETGTIRVGRTADADTFSDSTSLVTSSRENKSMLRRDSTKSAMVTPKRTRQAKKVGHLDIKIRGKLGEVIEKAYRRNARDHSFLTIRNSHIQTHIMDEALAHRPYLEIILKSSMRVYNDTAIFDAEIKGDIYSALGKYSSELPDVIQKTIENWKTFSKLEIKTFQLIFALDGNSPRDLPASGPVKVYAPSYFIERTKIPGCFNTHYYCFTSSLFITKFELH